MKWLRLFFNKLFLKVEPVRDNINMFLLNPPKKKKTKLEDIEERTRARIIWLHWRILELKRQKEIDMKRPDGHPCMWNKIIDTAREEMNVHILIRNHLNLPKIERY